MSLVSSNLVWVVIFGIVAVVLIGFIGGTAITTTLTQACDPQGNNKFSLSCPPPSSCTFEILIPCFNYLAYVAGIASQFFTIFITSGINLLSFFPYPFNIIIGLTVIIITGFIIISIVKP